MQMGIANIIACIAILQMGDIVWRWAASEREHRVHAGHRALLEPQDVASVVHVQRAG